MEVGWATKGWWARKRSQLASSKLTQRAAQARELSQVAGCSSSCCGCSCGCRGGGYWRCWRSCDPSTAAGASKHGFPHRVLEARTDELPLLLPNLHAVAVGAAKSEGGARGWERRVGSVERWVGGGGERLNGSDERHARCRQAVPQATDSSSAAAAGPSHLQSPGPIFMATFLSMTAAYSSL